MWKLFWLLFFLQRFVIIFVNSLSLCDAWKYLEVIEHSDDNTYTCTGLNAQQDVVWSWDTDRIATCPPPTSTCTVLTPTANKFFRFSRTSTTASAVTVLATAAPTLDYFGTTSLTCEISAQESVVCPLDSVYPAENITCRVQFNGDTWEVTAWCFVSKVRSTRNKYGCYLYQTQDAQGPTRVDSFMSIVASTSSGYFSGTCNMTSYLPSEGRYSYTVLIKPGEVNVPAAFYGSNEIRRPNSIPYHNCPPYVKEDNSVSCVCSVNDLGSPPGQLKWNNISSEQLVLPGVKMDQHGVNYVCSLTWNRTVVQLVTYTLLVAYPPTQMNFKLNNASENVVVTEKSTVTMLCQSDGRPTPNMTITDVTNGNRVLHSQPGGNVTLADHRVETRYNKATVECEDTGEYRCSADNIIGSKYQAVKLFVMCAPRRNPVDANYTTPAVEEGKSVTIELIVYPTSVNVTKYFLGPNISSNEQIARESVFLVACNPSPPPSYRVICTITVTNVTSDTAGFYKVIVINQAGNFSFAFQALSRNTTVQEAATAGTNSEEPSADAIAGGVVGGVVVAGLVAIAIVCFVRRKRIGLWVAAAEAPIFATLVLVFLLRRRKQTSDARGGRKNTAYSSRQDIVSDKTTELNSLRSPSGHDKNEQESAYEVISSSETGQEAAYTNVEASVLSRKTSDKPGNIYDGLRLHDVGVSSPYASLS